VFNVTGSEVVILLLLALVVLGPEKLPDAIRRFGKVYGELRKMSQGFQTELRDALDEPMRELRSTADMARRAIEEPVDEISGSAKGIGQAATDAFAAATKFSAAPVQDGNARKQSPPASADKMAAATPVTATPTDGVPTDGMPTASTSPEAELVAESIAEPDAESVVPHVTDEQLSELPVSEEWPEAAAAPMDDPGDEPEPEELEGDEFASEDGVVDDTGGERTSA
jgi:sec-independent protein translocase protein TatB